MISQPMEGVAMPRSKVQISVTMDKELLEKIDEECAALHMGRSAFISGLLSTGLGLASPVAFLRDAYQGATSEPVSSGAADGRATAAAN